MTQSATVDTELLDRVFDLITRVPAVHDQATYGRALDSSERAQALQETVQAPDLERWADCGTAHCVAGWVLVLKGHQQDRFGYLLNLGEEGYVQDDAQVAAAYLGIDREVAYDDDEGIGIFSTTTTLSQIGDWIGYFKDLLSRSELLRSLGREDLLGSDLLGGPDA